MTEKIEKFFGEVPPRLIPYDYDNPSHPFTPEQIAYIESVRDFLSEAELVQLRRLERFRYNTFFGTPGELGIPGLRSSENIYCMYLRRYDDRFYGELVNSFLIKVYEDFSAENVNRVLMPGCRVTTPDDDRCYAFEFHGDLQAWIDRMIAVAVQLGTLMAWFDRGKFCLMDGREFAFSDLQIDRLQGGKPVPKGW